MRDPYIVLGLDRKADPEAIKVAYRTLAKRYHPDLAGEDQSTRDRFQEINAAYDLLRDSSLRHRYDRGEIRADGLATKKRAAPQTNSNAKSSRAHATSQRQAYSRTAAEFAKPASPLRQSFKSASIQAESTRAAQRNQQERPFGLDSIKGAERHLDFGLQKADEIIGDIFSSLKPKPKPIENKKGQDERYNLPISFQESARGGIRRIKLPNGQKLDVKIPAGIRDKQQIRLQGQGQQGQGEGSAGDALIQISIEPQANFKRENDDVLLDLCVTVDEAVLGARIMVPTVDGPTALTIPSGSNADTVLTLKGLGFPKDGDGPTRPLGDQHISLRIVLPPSSNKAFTQFVKKWAGWNPYNVRGEFDI